MIGKRAGKNRVKATGKGHTVTAESCHFGELSWSIQIINEDCRWECWCSDIIKFYHVQSWHCQQVEWRDWFTSSECNSNLITYVFQIGHSGKPGFIIIICACWTYQHLGSEAVLINHIVLLIFYIYIVIVIYVSVYIYSPVWHYSSLWERFIFFSRVILTLIRIVLLQSEVLVYGPLGQRWCSQKSDANFSGAPIFCILLFLSSTQREKPHSSDLMGKAVSEKTPLRNLSVCGIAIPRGSGHSPLWMCSLDQHNAHPSPASTNLSTSHWLLMVFPARSTAP